MQHHWRLLFFSILINLHGCSSTEQRSNDGQSQPDMAGASPAPSQSTTNTSASNDATTPSGVGGSIAPTTTPPPALSNTSNEAGAPSGGASSNGPRPTDAFAGATAEDDVNANDQGTNGTMAGTASNGGGQAASNDLLDDQAGAAVDTPNDEDESSPAGQPANDEEPPPAGQPANDEEPPPAGQPANDEEPPPVENAQLPVRQPRGLPRIHDFSGAPPDQVDTLVRSALNGLGLDERTGPAPQDRVFVGRWYMAWIDETGFYGKINGLWSLNGDPDNLRFILLDGERPVNAFIVGENGNGEWPGGYTGAEHIEFPNSVPEADDDPNCARQGSFCAQYSHGEAPRYTDPDIPTWRACNDGSPTWDTHFEPYEIVPTPSGLRIMYEGPLTKQGDFGGSQDGNNCHADFLFPDGQRRRVYLRVGYELSADGHAVDRLLQVRNPDGNPEFDGSFSFIGGFVLTTWPNPHPLKRLNRHVRVDDAAVEVRWQDDRVRIEPDRWTALPGTIPDHDVVLGWARQPVTLSAYADYTEAQAFTLSNHGEDNGDSGFCLCTVHGAIEMGGGLISVPVPGGAESHLARRRLTLHHEVARPEPRVWTYEAETDLSHRFGRADADGWSASTGDDDAGHLAFGPYASDWGEGPRSATFRLMVDVADERDERVVVLDIYDADADEVLVSRPIVRSDFLASFQYQDFTLEFDMTGRANHRMETRVYWRDISYVRLDRVIVRE